MSKINPPRLGWIGQGSMGLAMARNLQKHLSVTIGMSPLTCTNRTISRAKSIVEAGGRSVDTVAEVVEASDIICISTSDDPVLQNIIREVIDSGDISNKLIVDTTTIHPNTSKSVHGQLTAAGASYLAAPVFGASPLAEGGQLLFILGGPQEAIDRIAPYIKGIMGRGFVTVGEAPEKALLMKTAGNFITARLMEVISEAHVFAEKTGLGCDILQNVIEQNWGGILHATSERITSGAYCPPPGERPRSDLRLAVKDVRHGISAAKDVGSSLPVAEVVMDHYHKALEWQKDHNDRQLDSSSMYGVLRKEADLDFESAEVKAFEKRSQLEGV